MNNYGIAFGDVLCVQPHALADASLRIFTLKGGIDDNAERSGHINYSLLIIHYSLF